MENWGKIGKRKKDGVLKGGTFSTHEEEEKRRFGKNETFSTHWEWTSKQNRERSLKKEEKNRGGLLQQKGRLPLKDNKHISIRNSPRQPDQGLGFKQEAITLQLQAVVDWVLKLNQLRSLRLKSINESNQPWDLELKPLVSLVNLSYI